MKQREVQDGEKRNWTCVQAFSGVEGEAAAAAQAHVENADALVPVVCTPSGGTGTRRLELPPSWAEELSDSELVERIDAAA